MWVQCLGSGISPRGGSSTHMGILAWKILIDRCTLAGYGPWGHKESDRLSTNVNLNKLC